MFKINKYNRENAIAYAHQFALQKNPTFFDYTNQGGNCTNYISQCIYSGAPVMNTSVNGWYYFSPSKTSVSWANVEPLYHFLISNTSEGPFAKEIDLQSCEVGDIIQLKFPHKQAYSHCLIITKITDKSPSGIYVCANTRDVKDVQLNFYRFEKLRVLHILGYRTNINIF